MPAETPQEIQYAHFSKVTDKVLRTQAEEDPACGVKFMTGYDFLANPSDAYRQFKGGYSDAPGFTLLSQDELPKGMGITYGTKYETWCLNSPVYCAYLLRRFRLCKGLTLKKTLLSVDEAFSLAENVRVVVNCSGFGFGDPEVFPLRGTSYMLYSFGSLHIMCQCACHLKLSAYHHTGQTCMVRNSCDRTITQFGGDGAFTFIIPRPLEGGTIIGGTRDARDWEDKPRAETRADILSRAAKMFPPILGDSGKFDVIRDIVGRRPARNGGLRLEYESPRDDELHGRKIVHAYGAAGSGYAISWGVAEEVVKMVVAASGLVQARAQL